ncbi:MAG: hypothetical protein HC905_18160 [Bacteroidales bacterium]|nr:hypothetical protein [Bacteroidales bacterium]
MSKETFELKRTAIEAIANAKEPAIPVAIALQEAEDLYEWSQDDKEKLIKAGIDWNLVNDLPLRIGACRYIQSIWQKEFNSVETAQKEWGEKSPAAFELRDELLHHCFHAYRNIPDLLSIVQKIADGGGNADMIQDLSDLSVLAKANPEPLAKVNIDQNLFDEAATISAEMADLLAKSNGARLKGNKMKITRDKAYAYVKEAVDEIRHHGQYIFWRDEARKKGYVSMFFQQKNSLSRKKGNA